MTIAFLSDIHANFPALCEALARARREGAERVVCAGDVVGFGPHPLEVVRLLTEERVSAVCGNVDRDVLALLGRPKKLRKLERRGDLSPEAWAALALGATERRWLAALPERLEFEEGGARILVVHGSPLGDTDYIYPSLTSEALASKLGEFGPAVLVCGHSHIPFARKVGGVQVVNCGSVGRPLDGDPRGSLALCDFPGGGAVRARVVRFSYPVETAAGDAAKRRGCGIAPEEYRLGMKRKEA